MLRARTRRLEAARAQIVRWRARGAAREGRLAVQLTRLALDRGHRVVEAGHAGLAGGGFVGARRLAFHRKLAPVRATEGAQNLLLLAEEVRAVHAEAPDVDVGAAGRLAVAQSATNSVSNTGRKHGIAILAETRALSPCSPSSSEIVARHIVLTDGTNLVLHKVLPLTSPPLLYHPLLNLLPPSQKRPPPSLPSSRIKIPLQTLLNLRLRQAKLPTKRVVAGDSQDLGHHV